MTVPVELGTALANRYDIERELGRGGMATVYLAHDLKHEREVAVKVLLPGIAAALGPDRFLREIRTAARLTHPHIVGLHDSGEAQGFLYYVMPYIRGESLRQRLDRGGRLDLDEVIAITKDVAAALDYAHAAGLLHRDIKPENILLHEGEAMVVDFGIALAVNSAGGKRLTETGLSLGTPTYMSPEQIAGDRVLDGRSDQYALACVVYEMLTGAPPYQAATAAGIIVKHATAPIPSVRRLRTDTSPMVDEAVTRALAKNPEQRFESIRAFTEALRVPQPRLKSGDVPAASEKSVLVLPFANLSPDPENEYFSDGITEDIIAQLAKIGDLKVVSRTSAMQFKHRTASLPEIALRLGVRTVVEGSVRRVGDRVRIVAQLVDAGSDQHLWAERYDRAMTDIFAIQAEVAERIAEALKAVLSPVERAQIGGSRTRNLEAYNAHLLGRFYANKWSSEAWQKAERHLAEAISLDPDYAAPHATLALNYVVRAYTNVLPPGDAFRRAEAEARIALDLDPGDTNAHLALGVVAQWFLWDWLLAEREMQRAIELSPGNAIARTFYGSLLDTLGRHETAMQERQRSYELDPLDPAATFNLAYGYMIGRRFEEAQAQFRRALELDAKSAAAIYGLGMVQADGGSPEAACATFEHGLAEVDNSSTMMGLLGWAYGRAGRRADAEHVLSQLLQLAAKSYVSSYHVALIFLGLGRIDEFFIWLERAYIERSTWMAWIHVTPSLDSVKADPRFKDILGRMGLMSTPAHHDRSIVVLPFANLSPDADNEYFADGMTEEIINALANIPDLRVIARTSSFALKGAERDVRTIGRELGVGTVLEGSVRRAGNRLRITAQLVDVAGGHQLWSEKFDRDLADVFAIQDEIAGTIARRLQPAAAPTAARSAPPTQSLDAYEAYLRGRFYWGKGSEADYGRAVEQFERAITLDPSFARSYVGLAETLCYRTIYFGGDEDQPRRAKELALRALALDANLADAHATLGYLAFWFEWNWTTAIEGLERAVQLNPNSPTAHNQYSVLLATLWGDERAIDQSRRAIELDPLWAVAHQSLQWALYQAGRFDDSITAGLKALELEPGYVMAHRAIGFALLETGAFDEAEAAFRQALALSPDDGIAQAGLVQVWARQGRTEAARRAAAELSSRALSEKGLASFASWANAACGERDEAFAWIERAIAERSQFLTGLVSFRWWDPLRSDPRFQQLLLRLQFPSRERTLQ